MDILRFVNSKDIRKHLEKIGYKFSPLEAAWLIFQWWNATIEERHRAWEELIQTMPDCEVPERLNTRRQKSLHAFLRRYMELEDRFVAEFLGDSPEGTDTGPYMYRMEYKYKDGGIVKDGAVYSSFTKLRAAVTPPEEGVLMMRCVRTRPDEPEERQWVLYVTEAFDPTEVEPAVIDNEDENTICNKVFQGLWFDFPTPFKKGDILWDPRCPYGYCAGPFAVTGINLEGIESENTRESLIKDGDLTDMCAYGYYLNPNGGIYHECMWNYMDLEYYDKELEGSSRTLIAMSSFLKGEIDAGLLARAYHQIMTEGYAENCRPHDISNEGLILAGLKKPEHIKIWLDDEREAPEGYFRCRSVNAAKRVISACETEGTVIDVIDCDHDLGEYAWDGGDAIKLIDWLAERGTFYPIELHTMNPVGRENMQREIGRYWNER